MQRFWMWSTALCTCLLSAGNLCQAQSTEQAPIGTRESLAVPSNGTLTTTLFDTSLTSYGCQLNASPTRQVPFPVLLPPNLTSPLPDITMSLIKSARNPLLKIFCNPNWGQFAERFPSATYYVWASTTIRGNEYLTINGRHPIFQTEGELDLGVPLLMCSLVNDDQSGATTSYTLQAYAERTSVTLNGIAQEALSSLYTECCQGSGACAQWPKQARSGSPNFNLCGVLGQRCSSTGDLVGLDLQSVNLTCTWPTTQLRQLTSLVTLNLANNTMLRGNTSQVFTTLAAMPSLQAVALDDTQIVGPLQPTSGDSICTLGANVSTVLMRNAGFLIGSIPACVFAANGSIAVLDVSGSGLDSQLPTMSSGAPIQALRASNTRLTGPLPFLGEPMASMTHLELSTCNLQGTVPVSLGEFPFLQRINISNNAFSGTVPNLLGAPNLLSVDLGENDLSALAQPWLSPSSLTASTKLQGVYLEFNALRGGFPSALTAAQTLFVLTLFHNRLDGTLPDLEAGRNFTRLRFLDAANNSLQGTIPPSWQSSGIFQSSPLLPLQNIFNISNNNLTGAIPGFLNDSRIGANVTIRLQNPSTPASPPPSATTPVTSSGTPPSVTGTTAAPGIEAPGGVQMSNSPPAQTSVDSSPAAQGGTSNKLSGGAIAGIVIGVIAGLALIAALIMLCSRKRPASQPDDVNAGTKYTGSKHLGGVPTLPSMGSSVKGAIRAATGSHRSDGKFERFRDEPLAGQLEIPQLRDP